jgi:chloride channel 3/4/5
MIWFNGFPFLDNKEEHTFGVPVSQVMTSDVVAIPTSGLLVKDVESLLKGDEYQGFPIVEDAESKILVGYIGHTELRYAMDRARKERSIGPNARCYFSPPASHNPITPTTPAVATFSATASTSVDFNRYIDPTPVTVHPRLPLETVMELFRKIGPRVILIEYHGRLSGLVTVKDCLKYQFKAEASENPRDDRHVVEGQERLWGVIKKSAFWVSDRINHASRGRIRISTPQPGERRAFSSFGRVSPEEMMDGTEDVQDDGVELEDR